MTPRLRRPTAEPRTLARLEVRMSPAELDDLRRDARESGLTVSDYVRTCLALPTRSDSHALR